MTEKLISAMKNREDIKQFLYNDLEYAVFDDYIELQKIKHKFPQAVMSGSGSTYFMLEDINENPISEEYQVISGLNFINHGVEISKL